MCASFYNPKTVTLPNQDTLEPVDLEVLTATMESTTGRCGIGCDVERRLYLSLGVTYM